jgi:hypothetical protein
LRVRLFVNFSFSALMNSRTHGVQAGRSLTLPVAIAREKTPFSKRPPLGARVVKVHP